MPRANCERISSLELPTVTLRFQREAYSGVDVHVDAASDFVFSLYSIEYEGNADLCSNVQLLLLVYHTGPLAT